MELNLHKNWENLFKNEFDKPYFKELSDFIDEEYKIKRCFPEKSRVFAAFDYFPPEKTKVVILGQDPYHGEGQANGLCFSVQEGIAFPPSLVNIFKEIQSDLGVSFPESGNLERWASQGVLLLNATLSVEKGRAGSHQKKGWEIFTDFVIASLSITYENIVFLLWGGYAQKKIKLIDSQKHLVLVSGHPSPLSANRGFWFGNKHFSQANAFLNSVGKEIIKW